MPDQPTRGTAPARGYEQVASTNADGTLRAGRGVPDQARDFAERREETLSPSRDAAAPAHGRDALEGEGEAEGATSRATQDTPQQLHGGITPSPR